MQQTEIQTFLSLISKDGYNFDINKVSHALCTVPTKTRELGQVINNHYYFPHTEWSLTFETKKVVEVEEALIEVFSFIEEKADTMRKLSRDCDADWHILMLITVRNEEKPVIYLSPKSLTYLKSINAHWGIDLYWL